MDKIKRFLDKNNIEYYENFDFSSISTIRLGARVNLAIFPKNVNELVKMLTFFYTFKIPYKMIGNASNVLVVKNLDFPLIITSKMADEISIKDGKVSVSGGMLIYKFCDILRKNRLSGAEGLINIPATIGGAIMCNAGAFGQSISDHLVSVDAFYNGRVVTLFKNEIKFGHHFSNLFGFVILSATFLFESKNEYDIISLSNKFTYTRGQTQPSGFSLGSVYRKINGKSAGFYIERSGLKGVRIGGVMVSNKHSNFFINDKGGSVMDFLRLLALVNFEVERQFGLTLIPEIEKVGDNNEINSRFSYSFKL